MLMRLTAGATRSLHFLGINRLKRASEATWRHLHLQEQEVCFEAVRQVCGPGSGCGFLLIVPIYLAILLLLKAMNSVGNRLI